MKKSIILHNFGISVAVALISMACASNNGGTDSDDDNPNVTEPPVVEPTEEYMAPEPSAEINYAQLFSVDFVSNLQDKPLFEGDDYSAAISHIGVQSSSAIHIFDRADMEVLKSVPHTAIAVAKDMRGVFSAEECGEGKIKGSAIICDQYIDYCVGVWKKDIFMASGCTIYVPTTPTKDVSVITSTLSTEDQIDALFAKLKDEFQDNLIFVGKVENAQRETLEKHLRCNYKNFRLYTHESQNDYSIWALSPLSIVCRQVVDVASAELPHYVLRLEILN